jgi:hypothetical protein
VRNYVRSKGELYNRTDKDKVNKEKSRVQNENREG